jgi:PKD repeat protein
MLSHHRTVSRRRPGPSGYGAAGPNWRMVDGSPTLRMEPAMPTSRRPPAVLVALLSALVALTALAPSARAEGVPPPNAAFSVAIDGLDVAFTDLSTGAPTGWTWDFGDGSGSDVQNPSHTFAAGRYRVKLSVTNDGGSDHVSHTVTVKTPPPDQLYSANLYSTRVRYQNPDLKACVATATMIMLNEVAASGHDGTGFRWTSSITLARQRSMIRWARAHDTLEPGPGGTDPNGWRNALNHYGWGDYRNPATMTYQVFADTSYEAGVKRAVAAMARYHRPVGMLGWAGGHAQVLHGYVVYGQDPATSMHFTVQYVYLTDPLRRDALRNARISFARLAAGPLRYRFRAYRQKDSPYDDPYTVGWLRADRGWYNRYVIVAPVR